MSRRRARFLWDLVQTFAIALVLALVIKTYFVGGYLVDGDSMNPTLYDRERVFITRLGLHDGLPGRGDVIVFRYPLDPSRDFVKRVVGLPGDELEIRQGRVYLNGSFVVEDYRLIRDHSSVPATRIPEGQLYVLGDNRPISEDSRHFGFVPAKNVRGRVFLVIWPPTRLRWVAAIEGGT